MRREGTKPLQHRTQSKGSEHNYTHTHRHPHAKGGRRRRDTQSLKLGAESIASVAFFTSAGGDGVVLSNTRTRSSTRPHNLPNTRTCTHARAYTHRHTHTRERPSSPYTRTGGRRRRDTQSVELGTEIIASNAVITSAGSDGAVLSNSLAATEATVQVCVACLTESPKTCVSFPSLFWPPSIQEGSGKSLHVHVANFEAPHWKLTRIYNRTTRTNRRKRMSKNLNSLTISPFAHIKFALPDGGG